MEIGIFCYESGADTPREGIGFDCRPENQG
jgi:hypothetical protein